MQNGFKTLKSQVFQTLRQEILSGAMPPGTRLVRRALSQRLGVSPIPVIEALHQLEKDGLVESEPMFGHRVRALSTEAVRSDHVLREAIECQAARLCAQNASPAQFEALARQAKELDTVLEGDPETATHAEAHLEFHLGIARATGFNGLVKALENLWFRRLMVLNTLNATTLGLPRDWHGRLVKALASRDAEVAEKAMREHVQFNVERQLELLEANSLLKQTARKKGSEPKSKKAAVKKPR
jgi:DNA-binding GntR family transcriptional regulator